MKKKVDIKSTVLGGLLAVAIMLSVAAAADRGTAWEYKVVTGLIYGGEQRHQLEDAINNHVAQGWQFVATSGVGERSGYAVMRRDKEAGR